MGNLRIKTVLLFSTLFALFFAAGVYAADGIQKVEAYLRPDFTIKADGQTVTFNNPPLIYNDSSYVPLKAVGELIGADIVWKDETKTIYINKRKYVDPPADENNGTYEEIQLEGPAGNIVTYLGREYPLLTNMYKYTTYYRLSDLQKMGLDVNGLSKVKEKLTGALYTRKDEADKVWKEGPVVHYPNGPLVTGENDPQKIQVLQKFSPVPVAVNDQYAYLRNYYGMIIVIDALPQENEYIALAYNGKYYKYHLKLAKNTEHKTVNGVEEIETTWYVSSYSSEEYES